MEVTSRFGGVTDTSVFWTSGDVYPEFEFQSQDGYLRLPALSVAYNGFLRSTSGATPADLLVARMTAEPFRTPDPELDRDIIHEICRIAWDSHLYLDLLLQGIGSCRVTWESRLYLDLLLQGIGSCRVAWDSHLYLDLL